MWENQQEACFFCCVCVSVFVCVGVCGCVYWSNFKMVLLWSSSCSGSRNIRRVRVDVGSRGFLLLQCLQCYSVTCYIGYFTLSQCYNVKVSQCYNIKASQCYNVKASQCYNGYVGQPCLFVVTPKLFTDFFLAHRRCDMWAPFDDIDILILIYWYWFWYVNITILKLIYCELH